MSQFLDNLSPLVLLGVWAVLIIGCDLGLKKMSERVKQSKLRGDSWFVRARKIIALVFSGIAALFIVLLIPFSLSTTKVGHIDKDKLNEAIYQRNAQSVVSAFASAKAAGLDFGRSSKDEVIKAVIKGGVVEDKNSAFVGEFFGGLTLPLEEVEGTAKYISFEDGAINYRHSPNE